MITVLSMVILQRPFAYSPNLASPAESVCTLFAASLSGEVSVAHFTGEVLAECPVGNAMQTTK